MSGMNNRRINTLFASAPFDPRSIAGLKLWLAADRISGLNDGDPVGTWSDASGQGNDASQATASKKPLFHLSDFNGHPSVSFDGVDDILSANGITSVLVGNDLPHTFIAVFAPTDAAGTYQVVGAGNTSTSALHQYRLALTSGNLNVLRRDDASVLANVTGSPVGTSPLVMVCLFTGTSISARKNGNNTLLASTTLDVGTTTPNTFSIGAHKTNSENTFFKGKVAEVLFYNALLQSADYQRLEKYLGSKYGITVS